MTSWHTYPQIYNLGHRAVADLLSDPVLVEEKIDGSQFSFGVFERIAVCDEPHEFVLQIRSKGAVMHPDAPEKMFTKAVEAVKRVEHLLQPGWTYRAEYLAKPKHNVLAYERTPANNLVIFDINTAEETYLGHVEKSTEAQRLGFEAVPVLYSGMVNTIEQFREFLEHTSMLGGQKIEGVVIKNYARFGLDKKVLMGKFVSEAFKEIHAAEWKKGNPSGQDVLGLIVEKLRTPARWQKAVQHLREAGGITQSSKDIGALIKEVQADIRKECIEEITGELMKWAMPHINRGVVRGLPEWWKEELLKEQFNNE